MISLDAKKTGNLYNRILEKCKERISGKSNVGLGICYSIVYTDGRVGVQVGLGYVERKWTRCYGFCLTIQGD